MNIRNLKVNKIGTIDMEIDHPIYGWIPFTAAPDDVEQHGRDLYAAAIDGKLGVIAPADPLPAADEVLAQKRANATLSRREFFLGLEAIGMYDTVMALRDDPATAKAVKIEIDTAASFERTWPTLLAMASLIEATEDQLDTLFGITQ